MLVTCQRFGYLFLFGLVWQYSSIQKNIMKVGSKPRLLTCVMVLLGLLGDVHKVNCTWNLKAIDEFQSLLIFAGRVESRFSFQSTEFHKSR